MFKNITQTQWVAFIIGAASFLGGATAQLTTLFGPNGAAYVASACAIISGLAGVFLMATTGQGSQVKQVLAMPGVEKLDVNAKASQVLAAIAVDPAQDKISPTPAAMQAVTQTAKGA